MKVGLICPSNMLYMPYVENYTRILEQIDGEYDMIHWDRCHIQEKNKLVFRDKKACYQKGLLEYLGYARFVINLIKENHYDKIIVFSIQLVFFTKALLNNKYRNRFIIDIRDHNQTIRYFNIKKTMKNAAFTVLSSPGYKKWLPQSTRTIINHNSRIESLDGLWKVDTQLKTKEHITVNYIGAIRDYENNVLFINALKNAKKIQLNYHGEGKSNKCIKTYITDHDIKNVRVTGRYEKEQESKLYLCTDIVNGLVPNDNINNKTLLPNRLYDAAIYGKPILAFEGTYLSTIIKKYQLGLVIDSYHNAEDKILDYIKSFDIDLYEKGRRLFLDSVIKENKKFKEQLEGFLMGGSHDST